MVSPIWFDDEKTWGLEYRMSVIWYYYPHRRHDHMTGGLATGKLQLDANYKLMEDSVFVLF